MTFFSYLIPEGWDENNTFRKMPKKSLALTIVKKPLVFELMLAIAVGNPGLAIRRTRVVVSPVSGSVQVHSTSQGLDVSSSKMGIKYLLCIQHFCEC